jgi:hypothetical protein
MENKLVLLKTYETMVELLFDQEILLENNIQSTIHNQGLVELYPMFGELNDGLSLLVFDTDLQQSIQILNEYQAAIQAEH